MVIKIWYCNSVGNFTMVYRETGNRFISNFEPHYTSELQQSTAVTLLFLSANLRSV